MVWAMTMLMKNPDSLKKLQQEVRNAVGTKGKVEEDDLYKIDYLKAVIKETLRLYPVLPLLVPHESRDRCVLEGYEIPKKTMVYVNASAVGRDPKFWEQPEPERFMGSNVEYKGLDFEWIPFGSGQWRSLRFPTGGGGGVRKSPDLKISIKPGGGSKTYISKYFYTRNYILSTTERMLLGATAVEMALSNLVYSFNWELPEGTKDIDTLKTEGTVMFKKNVLLLVAKVPNNGCKSLLNLNEAK
ncbi:putative alpha-humulene 10-hydroxylase [Helianthus anomalus]